MKAIVGDTIAHIVAKTTGDRPDAPLTPLKGFERQGRR
jgi:hypothetical protein